MLKRTPPEALQEDQEQESGFRRLIRTFDPEFRATFFGRSCSGGCDLPTSGAPWLLAARGGANWRVPTAAAKKRGRCGGSLEDELRQRGGASGTRAGTAGTKGDVPAHDIAAPYGRLSPRTPGGSCLACQRPPEVSSSTRPSPGTPILVRLSLGKGSNTTMRFAISFTSWCYLLLIACSAYAQIATSPSQETSVDRFRARGAESECGPIGCRPLPLGCRQVSLGGHWIDNNGRRVVCDKKRRTNR